MKPSDRQLLASSVAEAERDGAVCACGTVTCGPKDPCAACDPALDRRTPMQRRLANRKSAQPVPTNRQTTGQDAQTLDGETVCDRGSAASSGTSEP